MKNPRKFCLELYEVLKSAEAQNWWIHGIYMEILMFISKIYTDMCFLSL
jgi:hypothetical protein